jgi:hypothetical protein
MKLLKLTKSSPVTFCDCIYIHVPGGTYTCTYIFNLTTVKNMLYNAAINAAINAMTENHDGKPMEAPFKHVCNFNHAKKHIIGSNALLKTEAATDASYNFATDETSHRCSVYL